MLSQRRFLLILATAGLIVCAYLASHIWHCQQQQQQSSAAGLASSSSSSSNRVMQLDRSVGTADSDVPEIRSAGSAAAEPAELPPQKAGDSVSGGSKIPCIIHQSWKTSRLPSARAVRWQSTWHKCLPGCQYRLWSDIDNRRLVSSKYPWLLQMYDALPRGVQRADVVRYLYMLHYGGIYTDLDTVCVRDFRHLLRNVSVAFGGMKGHWMRSVNGTYVQNSFMASEPGHPFWLGLVLRILRQYRRKPGGGGAEETTGPLVLMAELQQYLDSGDGGLTIFPYQYFNPFSWIASGNRRCKTHGRMSEADEAACVASFPDAYVVQMHCKSWGGGSA